MKITILDARTLGHLPEIAQLEKYGALEIYEVTSSAQTPERVLHSDIIITNKVVIDKNIIDQALRLKLICVAATGMNNIDLDYAREKGIEVKNVKDYSTHSVAQHTFSLLFALTNRMIFFDDYVKSGAYSSNEIFTYPDIEIPELRGKTFGIIGLGAIGKRVAEIASCFGAEVCWFSASGRRGEEPYTQIRDLKDFLSRCDIISIHAPLSERTKDLITYERISCMKSSALLINAGRGGIVKEEDLARALDENLIAGAALDVYAQEPVAEDNPLLKIKDPSKIVLSPHVAWASIEARRTLMKEIIRNIEAFLGNNP